MNIDPPPPSPPEDDEPLWVKDMVEDFDDEEWEQYEQWMNEPDIAMFSVSEPGVCRLKTKQ